MKKYSHRSKRFLQKSLGLGSASLCLLGTFLAGKSQAATSLYFDSNGTAAGYGTGGSWDGSNWATASGGTSATSTWVSGDFARFYTAASSTVTVGSTEVLAGLYNTVSAATLTINQTASTSGNLSITTTGDASVDGGLAVVQGFLTTGAVVINAPVTGSGGIEQETSGALSLFGANTYSGGTDLTGGQVTYYNNNSSFGTGNIIFTGSGEAMYSSASTAVTIPNNIYFAGGTSVNLAGGNAVAGAPGTTYSGNVSLGSSTINFETSSSSTTVDKISGVISGSGGITVSDLGTLILSGANTITNTVTVTSGRLTLGAAGTIASSKQVVLGGGILDPGGLQQNNSATLGLTSSSTIDFEAGTNTLSFANSSALTWAGTLTVSNYVSGDDLKIGTDATGLTSTQLSDIDFTGYTPGAIIDSSGDILPAPEPSTLLLGVVGGLGVLWSVRRRQS